MLTAAVPVVTPDVDTAREAGATVVPRDALARALIEPLRSNKRGALRLALLSEVARLRVLRRSLVSGSISYIVCNNGSFIDYQ